MRRRVTLLAMLAGLALVAAPLVTRHTPRLIWNSSASVPIGLYQVAPAAPIAVGDLVAVSAPEPLAAFLDERGYLPRGVPLLKHVLALPGATVCREGLTIIAYDQTHGAARERDRLGRPLPDWQGCRVIAEGEVFLMNWDAEDSFDGRYFGPLPVTSVTARILPVWTDVDGDGRFRWHGAGAEDGP